MEIDAENAFELMFFYLPHQVIHNDFHPGNVLADAAKIDIRLDRGIEPAPKCSAELQAKGIAETSIDLGRVRSEGFGETMPVASNDTADGRARNRRVEIKIVPVTLVTFLPIDRDGWGFVLTLLASNGHQLKLWMLVFGMVPFFVTAMAAVVAAIPREAFDHVELDGQAMAFCKLPPSIVHGEGFWIERCTTDGEPSASRSERR